MASKKLWLFDPPNRVKPTLTSDSHFYVRWPLFPGSWFWNAYQIKLIGYRKHLGEYYYQKGSFYIELAGEYTFKPGSYVTFALVAVMSGFAKVAVAVAGDPRIFPVRLRFLWCFSDSENDFTVFPGENYKCFHKYYSVTLVRWLSGQPYSLSPTFPHFCLKYGYVHNPSRSWYDH